MPCAKSSPDIAEAQGMWHGHRRQKIKIYIKKTLFFQKTKQTHSSTIQDSSSLLENTRRTLVPQAQFPY